MTLSDRLRQYLKSLDARDAALGEAELDGLYFDVLALVERAPERVQADLTKLWLARDRLAAFARAVRSEARRRLGDTPSWRDIVLDQVRSEAWQGSTLKVSEARSLLIEALVQANRHWLWNDGPDPAAYARELQLVRGEPPALTSLGAVFLQLVGRDAVRWLLHLEVAQSTSPYDDWRVHRRSLEHIKQSRSLVHIDGHQDPDDGPWSWASFDRLSQLGLLEQVHPDPRENYAEAGFLLHASEIPLLDDVLSDPPSPMGLLAHSLVADLTAGVVTPSRTPDDARAGAAEYTAMARAIAHEIRNGLGPARTALGLLAGAIGAPTPDARTLLDRLDKQLQRMFEYASQMLHLSSLARSEPRAFALQSVVDEAVTGLGAELNGRVTVEVVGATHVTLVGQAERMRLALTELVRNAARATASPLRVRIGWRVAGTRLRLEVEDDGPGVPPDLAERLFQPGVSGTGHSGLGLSIVRDVVEGDHRGTLHHEPNLPRGSRFVMDLPLPTEESA